MAWSTHFDEPINLPDGRRLSTLREAADYIIQMTPAEHAVTEWQVAMEALILIAERGGPNMLARISVMRALNRHVAIVYDSDLKMPHWGKRKLKRDR